MEAPCIFLGIKVKPGPIERFKLENYGLDNTVDNLRSEAEKKSNVPSSSLELVHHGKILRDSSTLLDSGVKNGEMVHVVKKKEKPPPAPRPTYTDAELQQLNTSLRALGCTPNAPGWTRAMQLLNDENVMNEILEQAPSLADDCVALSILHEVELLAALGANIQTMRRGAEAHPELPAALRHLTRLEQQRANSSTPNDTGPALSGFAYSLEALSEEEDAEEEEAEETERNPITQEQLAAALQLATEAVSSSSNNYPSEGLPGLLRLLRRGHDHTRADNAGAGSSERAVITPEMFSEAISHAINRAGSGNSPTTPMEHGAPGINIASHERAVITPAMFSDAIIQAMTRPTAAPPTTEQNTEASSSQNPAPTEEDFTLQLTRMHEMGLLDDAVNVRALLICAGNVNAAINLVFSGAIGDD